MKTKPNIFKLGTAPWPTIDPFLFCVHHNDHYPDADEKMRPKANLSDRNIGSDFSGKDGWSMYHGTDVPGFPAHPHRGFETITIVRHGFVDHSDSYGASARYGEGDVQWMTAGSGIVHSEMFPLLNQFKSNPIELFQIWLNLPKSKKMSQPHIEMLWSESIPRIKITDEYKKNIEITLIAGTLEGYSAPKPPPNSWASSSGSDVAIMTITMEEKAKWKLPKVPTGCSRSIYFMRGRKIFVNNAPVDSMHGAHFHSSDAIEIVNGESPSEILLLQAKPINEPVAQYGPFVMNTNSELQQAFRDYQKTKFGGWQWSSSSPNHGRSSRRFAGNFDGKINYPINKRASDEQ